MLEGFVTTKLFLPPSHSSFHVLDGQHYPLGGLGVAHHGPALDHRDDCRLLKGCTEEGDRSEMVDSYMLHNLPSPSFPPPSLFASFIPLAFHT